MSKEWNGSDVMDDFVKIAAESGLLTTNLKPENKDFVGNPSKETPVKDHRRYEPGPEYNVTPEDDMVQKAHPEIAKLIDAMGNGGVVENQNEQQKKSIEIATKMPNGALVGVHAKLINNLVKLATQLDGAGKHKEAVRIDQTIERLARLPFSQSHFYKESWIPMAVMTLVSMFAPSVIDWWRTKKSPYGGRQLKYPGVKGKGLVSGKGRAIGAIGTGIGILGLLGSKVTSLQEGIREDTQDLLVTLGKAEEPSAQKAYQILNPLAGALVQADLGSDKGMQVFVTTIKKMTISLPALEKYITIYSKLEDPSKTGFGLSARVAEKFNDFTESLQEAQKTVAQITAVGAKMESQAKEDLQVAPVVAPTSEQGTNSVAMLQQILFHRGFPRGEVWKGEVTGKMDENTQTAAKALEHKLNETLKPLAQQQGLSGSFEGQVIAPNGTVIDVYQLSKILTLADKYIASGSK